MKSILAFIKKYWQLFTALVKTPEWILIFPASIFAVVALFTWSIIMVLVLAIWLITVAYNSKKD